MALITEAQLNMANLNEEPVWEAGIYQFETTDPVEGGPEGIDNKPTRQLANRTAYLKQEQDKLKDKFDVEKTPNPLPQYPLASAAQFLPYNPVRIYSVGEVCYTKDAGGELSYWQWYSNVESLAGKTPLDTANRHIGWQDNTKPFYWIPYTGDHFGMPFFWLAADAPEWAVMEINVDLPIAVYWRLARRYPDLVNGSVINTGEIRDEFLRVWDNGRGRTQNRELNSTQAPTQIPFISTNNSGANRYLVTPPIASFSNTLYPKNEEERIDAPVSGQYYQGTVSSAVNGANSLVSYATYPRNTARAI
ncbi:MAG: hypothetical protein ACRCXG_06235 [Vibrio sp.]